MSVWRVTFVAAIVTLHLTIADLGNFELTLGPVMLVALVMCFKRKAPSPGLIASSLLLMIQAILVYLLDEEGAIRGDSTFLSTFVLVMFAFGMVVMTLSIAPTEDQLKGLGAGAKDALAVVSIISLGQSVMGALGNYWLFNPWRSKQYLYNYIPSVGEGEIPRAQGFFLEPSYDAFVIGTCLMLCALAGTARRHTYVLAFVGLLSCRSATGVILLAICILVALFSSGKLRLELVIFLGIGGALLGRLAIDRLHSISSQGSSGNYRYSAPLIVLGDTLSRHPLGHPLGSVEDIMSQYSLLNGSEVGSTLDNGIYVVVFYFGWIGVLALIACALGILARLSKRPKNEASLCSVAQVWVFGSLLFSGAIFAPEFVVLNTLVLCLFSDWINRYEPRRAPGAPRIIGSLRHL